MATEISVRISRNPYGFPGARFEVSFVWNGLLNRYQFDNRFQLADKLVEDATEQLVIDEVMDSLDATEWGEQPIFPLGVFYVGEAVRDSPAADTDYPLFQPADAVCDCDACTKGHNALLIAELQSDARSLRRQMFWWLALVAIVALFV